MALSPERQLKVMTELYRADKDIPYETIHAVEGAKEQGDLTLKVMMVTKDFVVLKAKRGKGLISTSIPITNRSQRSSTAS